MLRHDFVSMCAIGLGVSIRILGGCVPIEPPPPQPAAVTFEVDTSITSPDAMDTVMSAGEERSVGMLLGPDGVTERFVEDEVLVRAETQEELDAFLAKYGGTVLRDGTVSSLPEELMEVEVERTSLYLVRVDLSMSSLDDMPANVEGAGIEGHLVFSSENAARLMSIVAREAPTGAAANLVLDLTSSLEHPDYSNGNLDAETWKWMNEDDDPFTAGDQGLSVGVTHAWDYLAYRNVPPTAPPGGSVTYSPVRVAVIDNGFALSTTTGRPLNDNADYFNTTNAPIQWDEDDGDNRAGGKSFEPSKPWHGQGAFGVCCAAERNQIGGAGTGGPVAQPILIKSGGTIYGVADSIIKAANMGAHVINISMGGYCGTLCRTADIFWDNRIADAVSAATDVGAIVVAGAGNEGDDLDNTGPNYVPCEVYKVLCVGSVLRENAISMRIRTRHNYGENVAISAPEGVIRDGIFSTLTPDAVESDEDYFALSDPTSNPDELGVFNGTSCATAFTSGVVALIKAADPDLDWEQVRDILQATANRPQSVDDRVPNGYVDAYRAVVASMSPNEPPSIGMTQPVDGQVIGWNTKPFFKTVYDDPEVDPMDLTALERFHGEVVITSSIDGELCRDSTLPYDCTSKLSQLTIGEHTITATATDAFGASSTDQIKVQVANRAPEPIILTPSANGAFYSHIPILFSSIVPDPDETILGDNVTWSSDIEGVMSNGFEFSQRLTTGTHTVTLEAADALGLSASDQVTIVVQTGVGAPTPVITSPVYGTLVAPGQMITITGEATDPEDGILPGASLEWSSSIDGVLGTGNSIQVILSSPAGPICESGAAHDITLKATDSDGKEVTVTILIRVGIIC